MPERRGRTRRQGGKQVASRPVPPAIYPNPTTSLVGRDREIAEVTELLQVSRLVTLTGLGGTGKTRLAIAVAEVLAEAGEEVAFVDLAALDSPEPVLASILSALGLRATADQGPIDLIAQRLQTDPMILVLDNFEHVTAAAPQVSELLTRCPQLRGLVTSRTRLRLSAERVYQVEPLAVPPESISSESMREFGAVRLFLERASETGGLGDPPDEDLAVVAEICRRLDGLPLAIELAAARARHLSIQALLARLEEPLTLLSGGPVDAPARHRALRHTIGWSYDLLEPDVAAFFADLGVFEGSFRLEAAHHIAGHRVGSTDAETLDALTALADQSLVRAVAAEDGEVRFVMHDAVSEYAVSVAVDEAAARGQHLEYYVGLAETAEPELERVDQARWTRVVVGELDNLRSALRWAYGSSSAVELVRLAVALGNFWRWHGDLREGREWLSRATLAAPPTDEALMAKVQRRAARIHHSLGDRDQARFLYDAARRNAEAAGDVNGASEALVSIGAMLTEERRYSEAAPLIDQGLELARSTGAAPYLATSILVKGMLMYTQGAIDEATPLYEEAVQIARREGDTRLAAVALTSLSDTRLLAGDYQGAVPLLREAIEYLEQTDDMAYASWAYLVLALALRKGGDLETARPVLERGTRLALESASPVDLIEAAEIMADWLGSAGANREALSGWAAAGKAREDLDIPRWPTDDGWINEGVARDRAALSKSAASEVWAAARDIELREAVERSLQALAVVSLASPEAKPRDRFALTTRESEVLALLVRGSTDKEIADELFISPKTASVHVANIKGKLGGSSRVDTVTRAVRIGLVDIPDADEL